MTAPIVVRPRPQEEFRLPNEILHGLDFDIPAGRIYGLIGHNGAGKTTTLNAMLGLTSYRGLGQGARPRPLCPSRPADARRRLHLRCRQPAALPQGARAVPHAHRHPSEFLGRQGASAFSMAPTSARRAASANLEQGHAGPAPSRGRDGHRRAPARPRRADARPRHHLSQALLSPSARRLHDADRTLLITTHQVDEIEFMLSDIMFIRDGRSVLHAPMEDVGRRFTQLVVTAREIAGRAWP